jgi:dTDP-4-dehydrorhamnose reductase
VAAYDPADDDAERSDEEEWRHMTPAASRIVISGAGGQVGTALAATAIRRGCDVLALTSAQWDITDASAAERIIQRDDVVINCAAGAHLH